ncbi:MAG: transposase [Burkholderia sp.]
MRLSPVPGFTNAALEVWAASSLMSTACVVSDGLWCFDGVTQKAASHERHVTGGGRQAADSTTLGHPFHAHLDRQSERSARRFALLV